MSSILINESYRLIRYSRFMQGHIGMMDWCGSSQWAYFSMIMLVMVALWLPMLLSVSFDWYIQLLDCLVIFLKQPVLTFHQKECEYRCMSLQFCSIHHTVQFIPLFSYSLLYFMLLAACSVYHPYSCWCLRCRMDMYFFSGSVLLTQHECMPNVFIHQRCFAGF